jgi:RNA ligase
MFKEIRTIEDVRPFVQDKQEIRFHRQPNGVTVGCYMFMDSHTFSNVEALECRGIGFDENGAICSRPLHKFFNVGEKAHLSPDLILERPDVVGIFEKLDGSMLATAWVHGALHWRSKKSFTSDVVKLTQAMLEAPEHANLVAFATEVASQGMTAIFEFTHPEARIVVAQTIPQLRLLHVRDNVTGAYLLLDEKHPIHALVNKHQVPRVEQFNALTLSEVFASLESMTDQEGYVLQFSNGDMVKLKCPWYQRFHRSITFLRERDIARSALNEELDDLKAVLTEAGIDLTKVNEVEAQLKANLLAISDAIDRMCTEGKSLERKEFALKYRSEPLFGLAMSQHIGQEVPLADWYTKNRLKSDFGLRVLADGALAEAMEG